MKTSINKQIPLHIKIAHRGLWNNEHPENSIGAFQRAIDAGTPIELDVHMLKDGTIIVFHDNNLKRMTNVDIDINKSDYNKIKNIKLKNTNYKIPLFEDVVKLIDGRVLLDIEIKTDFKNFKICRELCKTLDTYKGDFLIKSFNPLYIMWFRFNRKHFKRGLLVSKLKKQKLNPIIKFMLYKMYFNFLCSPDFISFDIKNLPNKKIEKLHQKGMPIFLWTIKGDMDFTIDYNGIIFEE